MTGTIGKETIALNSPDRKSDRESDWNGRQVHDRRPVRLTSTMIVNTADSDRREKVTVTTGGLPGDR